MEKTCCVCAEPKPEDAFPSYGKGAAKRRPQCRVCWNAFMRPRHRAYYEANREAHRQRAHAAVQKLVAYVRLRKALPCTDCGVQYPSYVMEFDHLHSKIMNVSAMVRRGVAIAKIRAEIEKCEVVCANCHRVRTFATRRVGIEPTPPSSLGLALNH